MRRFDLEGLELRCCACGRLLFKYERGARISGISIKCPRCRAMNTPRPRALPPKRDAQREGAKLGKIVHPPET
ncbi:Com family DNA-binding transcriptional regulator [Roseovarius sp. MS2]|uniref:Com family DNA-binding transcriptional regulator n=1 Tax=Roseovarius sp. MS2 TaxID=3390728 RepID=UPI003EDB7AEB